MADLNKLGGEYKALWTPTYTVGTGGAKAGQPIELDGTVAEAGEKILGIAMADVTAGDVDSVLALGEVRLKGGAAITAGQEIQVGTTTSGVTKFMPHTTGVSAGFALTACSGDGEYFQAFIRPVTLPVAGVFTTVPASATATGTAGQWSYDSSYIYICIATDTWKRAAISTWP